MPIAVAQTSGRQRSAIDLETGHTRMLDVPTVDAVSAIHMWAAPSLQGVVAVR